MMRTKLPINMPHHDGIKARISSINNAFVHGLLPVRPPSEEKFMKVLAILGAKRDDLRCAYCGEKATEWDHIHSIVSKGAPSWYIDEIENLIPCCPSCNSSKGGAERNGKSLDEWMRGKGFENRIDLVHRYIEEMNPKQHEELKNVVSKETWDNYWKIRDAIVKLMEVADAMQKQIKNKIESQN